MGRPKKDPVVIDDDLAEIYAALAGDNPEHGGGAYPDDDPVQPQELSSARHVPGMFHDGSWD